MKKQTRVAELLAELREYHRQLKLLKFELYDDLQVLLDTNEKYHKDKVAMRIMEKLKEIK